MEGLFAVVCGLDVRKHLLGPSAFPAAPLEHITNRITLSESRHTQSWAQTAGGVGTNAGLGLSGHVTGLKIHTHQDGHDSQGVSYTLGVNEDEASNSAASQWLAF